MPAKKPVPAVATNLLDAKPYTFRGATRWKYDISFRLADGSIVRLQKRLFHTRGEAITDGEKEIALYKAGIKKPADKHQGKRHKAVEKQAEITTAEALTLVLTHLENTKKLKLSTLSAYQHSINKYILPVLGHVVWKNISQKQIDELVRMAGGLVNPRQLQVLKAAIRESHRIGLTAPQVIVDSPPIRAKLKNDFINLQELERLCEQADPLWAAVCRFMFFTGIRVGELFAMKWGNIDFRRGTEMVRICSTVYPVKGAYIVGPPKNGTERSLPLNQSALSALKTIAAHRFPDRDPASFPDASMADTLVVANHRGSYLATPTFAAVLKRACKAAGIRRISPHTFRHSFATNLMAAGADIMEVKELLGHKSVAVTMRYAHFAPKGIRMATQRMDNLSSVA